MLGMRGKGPGVSLKIKLYYILSGCYEMDIKTI